MSQSKKALDAILNEGISAHEACLRFGISRAAISKEKLHPSAKSILEKQVYVLNEQCVFKDKTIDKLNGEMKQLRNELAARDLVISKMREALSIAMVGGDYLATERSQLNKMLASQPTTEALDAYVQRAVLEEREACAVLCEKRRRAPTAD